MFFRVSSAVSIGRRWVAVTVLFFAAACSQPTVAPPENPSSGEWRTFEGTWSASGTRQTLELETNHRASIFDLTGPLVLTGDYSFEWRFILESEDGSVGGRAVNLKGRARLGSATAAPGGGQSQ